MSGKCHVATFGCRVNQADSEAMLSTLAGRDFAPTGSHLDADLVVINSCTVTHRSDADIRKLVHRVERENPRAKVVVAGCYAQRDPGALVQLRGTSAVLGNSDRHRLGELVDRLFGAPAQGGPIVLRSELSDPDHLPPIEPIGVVQERTRPFVKIQDGCDAACTYCVIPEVRGPARSADHRAVIRSVRSLVEAGYFEVVIAGVHLGSYTSDGVDLAALVEAVLAEVPGLGRLRLSCIEPMAFPMALAALAAREPRLAPHFHLPLQAGHDRVLKRMARPYRVEEYAEIIAEIRARVPEACVGTDLIVGFPGESDAEFDEGLARCEAIGFDAIHVFSYSPRPGVPSTRLGGAVDPRIVKARATRATALGRARWAAFLERQIGAVRPALTLERAKADDDFVDALTDNYAPVRIHDPAQALAANRPIQVHLTARLGDRLAGEATTAAPRAR